MNVDFVRPEQYRAARAMLNLSRDDLAALAGVTASAIAHAEHRPEGVKRQALERIVDALGVSGVTFVRDAGRIGVLLRSRE